MAARGPGKLQATAEAEEEVSELETLSPEDLEAVVTEVDFEALSDDILREIQRRLGSESERQKLAPTILLQLGRDILKTRDEERAHEEYEPPELSEIIADAGLPADRKRQLVRSEILRVTAELDRLNAMLDALEKQ